MASRKKATNVGGVGSPSKSVSAVSVVDNNGEVIRTYSKEAHGADFRAHADEFAGKVEGRKVVKAVGPVEEDGGSEGGEDE